MDMNTNPQLLLPGADELKVKEGLEQAATKAAGKPMSISWRDFKRNMQRMAGSFGNNLQQVGNNLRNKLQSMDRWYVANCLYTIYGGAFVSSILACTSILFIYITGALATATVLQIIGAIAFLIPVLTLCIYWAINWLIQATMGMWNLAKSGVEAIKLMIQYRKEHPKENPLTAATESLKAQMKPAETNAY